MATLWLPGMRITATRLNQMDDVPLCNLVQAATGQTLVTGGWYPILWQDNPASVVVDSFSGFSFSSNGRYTSRLAGWYMVGGTVAFATNGTGQRGGFVYKNGTAIQGHGTFEVPNSGQISAYAIPTKPVYLAVGDYIELRAWQSSGGNLGTHVGADHSCSLSIAYHTAA